MIVDDERDQRLGAVRLYGEMMVRGRIAKYSQLHCALENQPLHVGPIVRAQLEFDLRVAHKRYTKLRAGNHNLRVRATAAGQTDPTPASFDWVIDRTGPNTNITSGPPAVTNNTSASFQFTSSEAGSTFECKLNTSGFAPCSSLQVYNGLGNRRHTFQVRAKDAPATRTTHRPCSTGCPLGHFLGEKL